MFAVTTTKARYAARAVVLALGRRGTPRKLGIPGEELSKVMYSLLDAEAYTGERILVVGGGDSAVEAAMGLAHQKGNRVVLSYRKERLHPAQGPERRKLREAMKKRQVEVLFDSSPVESGQMESCSRWGGEGRSPMTTSGSLPGEPRPTRSWRGSGSSWAGRT